MKASVGVLSGRQALVILVDWETDLADQLAAALVFRSIDVRRWTRSQLFSETLSPASVCAVSLRASEGSLDERLLGRIVQLSGKGIPVILQVDEASISEVFGMEEMPYAEIISLDTPTVQILKKMNLFAELHWQRRSLAQHDSEIKSLLAMIPDELLLLDREGRISEFRPGSGTRRATKFPISGNSTVGELFGLHGAGMLLNRVEDILNLGSGDMDCQVECLGQSRNAWLSYFDPDHVLLLVRAAPGLEANEATPQAALEHLEQELSSAKSLLHDLEESNAVKRRYFAQLSHEFRTPLNGVLGMAELLEESALTQEQQECVDVIKLSGDSLLAAANDILDFSKIEAGGMVLEHVRFDVRGCFEGVISMLRHKAESKGVDLGLMTQHGVPRYAVGDPGRLRQILLNLVNNALKFTDAGEISLEVQAAHAEPGEVHLSISVTDTGIGIPTDRLRSVFDPYVQAESTTSRNYGGTGLGLTICKELVAAMGGKICVESAVGKGSRFYFDVRMGQSAARVQEVTANLPSLDQLPVLVVGGSRLCTKLEANLESLGCRVTVVPGDRKLLRKMKIAASEGTPFQVVVFHYDFPGPDGIALGKQIRGDSTLKDVKLVLLTSTPFRGDGQYVGAAGIDAYLPMPVSEEELRRCIIAILENPGGQLQTRHVWEETDRKTVRVLVVDDSPVNQRVVLRMLCRLGLTCDVASNGEECLAALAASAYDLVLMDCQMPVMNGFEATRVIREQEGSTPILPIVALTAGAMESNREDCLAAGMTDYITKPVRIDRLRSVLGQYLELDESV